MSLMNGFAELDEEAQTETIAKVELLKLLGPRLSRPHADTLAGAKHANMKELRADTADRVLWIAFAFDPERKAVLLVAGNKTGVSQKRFYIDERYWAVEPTISGDVLLDRKAYRRTFPEFSGLRLFNLVGPTELFLKSLRGFVHLRNHACC